LRERRSSNHTFANSKASFDNSYPAFGLVHRTGREAEYGSWNRSEFDDDELALAEPFFGEIVSVK